MYASRPRRDRKLTNGQAFRHGVTTMQSCTHRVETAILLGSGARHDSQECVWLGAFSGEMNVRITTKARSQVDKWPGIQAWCNNHASCTHRVETAILLGSGARHDSQECVWLGAFSGEMNVRITTKTRSQVDQWPGIQAWCNNHAIMHASCRHCDLAWKWCEA